jgi:hypothetical protein
MEDTSPGLEAEVVEAREWASASIMQGTWLQTQSLARPEHGELSGSSGGVLQQYHRINAADQPNMSTHPPQTQPQNPSPTTAHTHHRHQHAPSPSKQPRRTHPRPPLPDPDHPYRNSAQNPPPDSR